jgi:hypothetical protein
MTLLFVVASGHKLIPSVIAGLEIVSGKPDNAVTRGQRTLAYAVENTTHLLQEHMLQICVISTKTLVASKVCCIVRMAL